jgi:hypothetical protein
MPEFRRFLNRRWQLGLLAAAALMFGLVMLHPYPRQSLFGPMIRGKPWCVWEDQIRRAVAPRQSLFDAIAEIFGVLGDAEISDDPALLPLYLHLANDSAAMVRLFSLSRLPRCLPIDELRRLPAEDETKILILTVLRERLEDDVPKCRITAADYLWRATGDREMIKVPLAHVNGLGTQFRDEARIVFCHMAAADPEVSFGPLSQWVEDPFPGRHVRVTAIQSMQHFGKRGIPLLRKALKDQDSEVRVAALFAIERLGADAADFKSELLTVQQSDSLQYCRQLASSALRNIDADRAPAQPKVNK